MNKTQTESNIHFFDDANPKTVFEPTKPTPKHLKDLTSPAQLSASFVCRDLSSTFVKEGTCALHNNLIAFYADGESESQKTPEFVIEISYSRLKGLPEVESSSKYGFSLARNENLYEFTTSSKQTVEDWMNALKCICVLSNFHEEYKAIKMIGKGSFAKVYLVESKSNGKHFAVKAFAKEGISQSNKGNAKPTMLNEIDLLRALDHENIIKLYEVHESERSLYLVMELIQGRSLQEVLTKLSVKKEYSQGQNLEMIRSILDALAYMASKGVMHRDLKPDNILVDKNGKVKIVDFGLATYINVSEYIFKKCGTPGYIAPEVFKYDAKSPSTFYDDRCDVFSAGCILFHMLFAYPFFDGSSASEILQLNREFNEFEALYTLKKEIKDPSSKINKEGLNLLFQLLEFNQKKRVSAAQALSHSYFTTVTPVSPLKLGSFKNLTDSPKNSQSELMSPTSFRNPELPSSFRSELSERNDQHRYTEKDSLYLDVGKPELNGKLNTLTNGSQNNSILVKNTATNSNNNSNNNSLSTFAKQVNQESETKRGHAYRASYNAGNKPSFLKAAIFNNMQKNGADSPTAIRKEKTNNLRIERRHTDNDIIKISKLQGSEDTASGPGSDASDQEDLEGESCRLKLQLDKIKSDTADKHSSKAQ